MLQNVGGDMRPPPAPLLLAPPGHPALSTGQGSEQHEPCYAEMRENFNKIITLLSIRARFPQPWSAAGNIFNSGQIFLAGFQEPSN